MESWVVGYDWLLKVSNEQEAKLKEKLVDLQSSPAATTRELEAWVLEKEEAHTREWAHTVEVDTQLAWTKDLLWLANEKIKATKEQATSVVVRMNEEYKMFDDFERDATKARADRCLVGFADYKDKVAQVFLKLDPSGISVVGAMLMEEGGAVEEEGAGIEEPVAEGTRPKVTITEGLGEPVIAFEMDT